jgi:hypothetical protein
MTQPTQEELLAAAVASKSDRGSEDNESNGASGRGRGRRLGGFRVGRQRNDDDEDGAPAKPIKTQTQQTEEDVGSDLSSAFSRSQTKELNVAFESLEQVRLANIDVEFNGINVEQRQCIACLRESIQLTGTTGPDGEVGMATPKRGLRKHLPRNKAVPCLTCGTPVCPRHRSADFKREQITICVECSRFLGFDFLVDAGDIPEIDRRQLMNSMLDVYDRGVLVLRYSSQFIGDISDSLQSNNRRNTKVGVGSSASGLVSGVTGVVAACTILTPIGPPLLIASVLFGGAGATASSASGAVNYHCQANKMANTIFVLHGMVRSILRLVPSADAIFFGEGRDETSRQDMKMAGSLQKVGGGTGKSAQNWSRAASNVIKPLTAGALSAASVVMEAREMKISIQQLRSGSPCERAEELRRIEKEILLLPETNVVADECKKYFMLGFDC